MTANTNRVKQFKFSVGGIVFEYIADDSLLLEVPEAHGGFTVMQGKPDIIIRVHCGELPKLHLEKKLYGNHESGEVWELYQSKDKLEFRLFSSLLGPLPYRVAVFDSSFTRGELYIRPRESAGTEDNSGLPSYDPVEYPLDEVFFVNLLSHGYGVNLHACGVKTGNDGIIFCGVSGAGKSTIAELWKKRPVKLLSDDRIIVRRIDGRLLMFGTPWHGDANVSLNEKAPLRAIYFLKQSKDNQANPLDLTESAFRLIVRSFPTFYSRKGMEYTLGLVSEIAQEVPCYELEFTADQRAIDTVLSHVESITQQSR